ncbi:hypothetical protein HOY82DRAFT_58307 [Tuber indicum]|nr:hypothetical protein HOY82DRAFT_58307 [Tuber indicum]
MLFAIYLLFFLMISYDPGAPYPHPMGRSDSRSRGTQHSGREWAFNATIRYTSRVFLPCNYRRLECSPCGTAKQEPMVS